MINAKDSLYAGGVRVGDARQVLTSNGSTLTWGDTKPAATPDAVKVGVRKKVEGLLDALDSHGLVVNGDAIHVGPPATVTTFTGGTFGLVDDPETPVQAVAQGLARALGAVAEKKAAEAGEHVCDPDGKCVEEELRLLGVSPEVNPRGDRVRAWIAKQNDWTLEQVAHLAFTEAALERYEERIAEEAAALRRATRSRWLRRALLAAVLGAGAAATLLLGGCTSQVVREAAAKHAATAAKHVVTLEGLDRIAQKHAGVGFTASESIALAAVTSQALGTGRESAGTAAELDRASR